MQSKAQTPRLATLLATYPFCAKGVYKASKTGSKEPQRLSARSRNYFSSGYTSHDFITIGPRCAITTALQPSTSIYRGLLVVPKVESTFPPNPHSLISANLSVGAPACTHPRRSNKHSWRILPPLKPPHLKHRHSPSNQVRSNSNLTRRSTRATHESYFLIYVT